MANNNDIITEAFLSAKTQMTSMIGRMLRSHDEAADVIQEAFCRLWPRRDTIANSSEAVALATTTAKNICIDRLRSNNRHPSVSVDEERDATPYMAADKLYETREQLEYVTRFIDEKLSETQRTVMQMKEFEGLEISEIAERLNMEESAVRMNLSRARKTIREYYLEVNK